MLTRTSRTRTSRTRTSRTRKNYFKETVKRKLKLDILIIIVKFLYEYISFNFSKEYKMYSPYYIFFIVLIKNLNDIKDELLSYIITNVMYVIFFGIIFKTRVEKYINENIFQKIYKILKNILIITAIVETIYVLYLYHYDNSEYINFNGHYYSIRSENLDNFNKLKDKYKNESFFTNEDYNDCEKFTKKYKIYIKKYHPDKYITNKLNKKLCEDITKDLNFLKEMICDN